MFWIVWEGEEAPCTPKNLEPRNSLEQERKQNQPWALKSMSPVVLTAEQQIPAAHGRNGEEGVPHDRLPHELENVS